MILATTNLQPGKHDDDNGAASLRQEDGIRCPRMRSPLSPDLLARHGGEHRADSYEGPCSALGSWAPVRKDSGTETGSG